MLFSNAGTSKVSKQRPFFVAHFNSPTMGRLARQRNGFAPQRRSGGRWNERAFTCHCRVGNVSSESLRSPQSLTSEGRKPKCPRNRLLKWEELLNPIE
jgi:hypothetical protein